MDIIQKRGIIDFFLMYATLSSTPYKDHPSKYTVDVADGDLIY